MEFLIGVIFGAVLVFLLVHKPTREWLVKRNKARREREKLEGDKPVKASAIRKKKYDKRGK